jgi:trypsin
MAASKQKDLLLALELITAPELPRIARSFAAEALKMQEKAKPWAMGKGIQGIGIAEKITDGQKLGVLAIKVYVEKKLPKSKLEDVVPKNLTVPGVEEKIETDIQEIGIVTKEPNTIRVRPAIPGFGVGHVNITVGTFGCLVRKKDDDETLYILSNSHVLADEGTGAVGDRVIQPGKYDGGAAPGDVIAELSQWIPFQFTSTGYPNTVDAAIAKVKNKASVTSAIRLIGVPTGASNRVRRGMRVQKTGRTTDYTQGIIQDINYRMALNYKIPGGGSGRVGLQDLVLCTRFTDGGDSGSAVLDMNKRIVGLHFAGSPSSSIFNKINNVLTQLDIDVVTSKI